MVPRSSVATTASRSPSSTTRTPWTGQAGFRGCGGGRRRGVTAACEVATCRCRRRRRCRRRAVPGAGRRTGRRPPAAAGSPGAVGAGCREGHGEPDGLARPVAPHLNAPGVGQRAHDVQPAPVRCVRFLFGWRGEAGGAVADLDPHPAGVGCDAGRPPRTRSPRAAPRWSTAPTA